MLLNRENNILPLFALSFIYINLNTNYKFKIIQNKYTLS